MFPNTPLILVSVLVEQIIRAHRAKLISTIQCIELVFLCATGISDETFQFPSQVSSTSALASGKYLNEETWRLASRDTLQYAGEKKIELLNVMQMGRSEIEQYKFLYNQLHERSSSEYVTQDKSPYSNG